MGCGWGAPGPAGELSCPGSTAQRPSTAATYLGGGGRYHSITAPPALLCSQLPSIPIIILGKAPVRARADGYARARPRIGGARAERLPATARDCSPRPCPPDGYARARPRVGGARALCPGHCAERLPPTAPRPPARSRGLGTCRRGRAPGPDRYPGHPRRHLRLEALFDVRPACYGLRLRWGDLPGGATVSPPARAPPAPRERPARPGRPDPAPQRLPALPRARPAVGPGVRGRRVQPRRPARVCHALPRH